MAFNLCKHNKVWSHVFIYVLPTNVAEKLYFLTKIVYILTLTPNRTEERCITFQLDVSSCDRGVSLIYWAKWRHGTRGSHSCRRPGRPVCPAAAPCSASWCAAAEQPKVTRKIKVFSDRSSQSEGGWGKNIKFIVLYPMAIFLSILCTPLERVWWRLYGLLGLNSETAGGLHVIQLMPSWISVFI